MKKFLAVLVFLSAATAGAAIAATADKPYDEAANAAQQIDAALAQAKSQGKSTLIVFGANWCGDCKVLDLHLKEPENAAILEKHYVMVHVNVGDKGIDSNFPIAERYGIPLKKGVPALAVLDANGNVVYSQKNGEFESMRAMDPKSVRQFLEKWQR